MVSLEVCAFCRADLPQPSMLPGVLTNYYPLPCKHALHLACAKQWAQHIHKTHLNASTMGCFLCMKIAPLPVQSPVKRIMAWVATAETIIFCARTTLMLGMLPITANFLRAHLSPQLGEGYEQWEEASPFSLMYFPALLVPCITEIAFELAGQTFHNLLNSIVTFGHNRVYGTHVNPSILPFYEGDGESITPERTLDSTVYLFVKTYFQHVRKALPLLTDQEKQYMQALDLAMGGTESGEDRLQVIAKAFINDTKVNDSNLYNKAMEAGYSLLVPSHAGEVGHVFLNRLLVFLEEKIRAALPPQQMTKEDRQLETQIVATMCLVFLKEKFASRNQSAQALIDTLLLERQDGTSRVVAAVYSKINEGGSVPYRLLMDCMFNPREQEDLKNVVLAAEQQRFAEVGLL